MPALTFAPVVSILAAFHRVSPVRPIRTFLRTAEDRLHPSHAQPLRPSITAARDHVLAAGHTPAHALATVLHESGRGPIPTIVLGGFVPDSTEQVFLLRRVLLRSGDIYYLNYSRTGFSLDLLCAQLDDLVTELNTRHGQAPVVFAVSFGAGLLLEWLRRTRRDGRHPSLAGTLIVSPVACVEDVISRTAAKPGTLLGRALKSCLEATGDRDVAAVEKSRQIFARMFEAGAQNRAALATLMTPAELQRLRSSVMDTIRGITAAGACERVRALAEFAAPPSYFSHALLPLSTAPALILFADREEAVLEPSSPTRFALESAHRAYFPAGRVRHIANRFGPPVQHASLIFHVFDYLPAVTAFYHGLRAKPLRAAA